MVEYEAGELIDTGRDDLVVVCGFVPELVFYEAVSDLCEPVDLDTVRFGMGEWVPSQDSTDLELVVMDTESGSGESFPVTYAEYI